VKDVEHNEPHRALCRVGAATESGAESGEIGLTVLSKADKLTVENDPPAGERVGECGQLGELLGA
jgi:hypothetical protein